MITQNNVIKSVYYDQQELLNAILELFNIDQFFLDPTYSKGVFYKNGKVPEPIIKSDLNPQQENIMQADVTNLIFENNSIPSIIFDPPFVVGLSDKPGIIRDRFGAIKNINQLWEFYYIASQELYRILSFDGYLIFKCQDVVSSGKNHFSHVSIANLAYHIGLKLIDLFILIAKNRIIGSMQKQYHARKYHCYFWVMQK